MAQAVFHLYLQFFSIFEAQLLQVTAPVLRDELSQTVPKAKLVISLVSCSPEFQTFMRDADRVSRALQQEQTQLHL